MLVVMARVEMQQVVALQQVAVALLQQVVMEIQVLQAAVVQAHLHIHLGALLQVRDKILVGLIGTLVAAEVALNR
jgi:hypothetical protein